MVCIANSSIITIIKDRIMSALTNDEDIFHAINSPNIKDFDLSDQLINTHIFPYHQNPNTIKDSITFITIQVQIPRSHDRNKTFVKPILEIWIISHEKNMKINNIPKITVNRNDYLSQLIDNKLNGKNDYGLGELKLETNVEGAFSSEHLYRKMIFETVDLNASKCNDWNDVN